MRLMGLRSRFSVLMMSSMDKLCITVLLAMVGLTEGVMGTLFFMHLSGFFGIVPFLVFRSSVGY